MTQDELELIAGENIAETIARTIETLNKSEHLTDLAGDPLSTAKLITVPEKRRIEDVTRQLREASEYLKPARRRGSAALDDLESLIAWGNRFKGETSVLYAKPNMAAPTLTCIADYHAAGAPDPTNANGDPTARHGSHRAVYSFPLSDEWKAWMKVSRGDSGGPVLLEKDDLGEFIEANAKDIMDPTPPILKGVEAAENEAWENRLIATAQKIEGRYGQLTQLLAMSKQFQVFETSNLTVSTNRDTGESEIQFLNEHKAHDGKPLKVPNLIIIAIPVFMGGAPYRMPVRFRYRKMGGQVRFILSVYNPEKAFEAAFREAIDKAQAEIDLPLFLGTPE